MGILLAFITFFLCQCEIKNLILCSTKKQRRISQGKLESKPPTNHITKTVPNKLYYFHGKKTDLVKSSKTYFQCKVITNVSNHETSKQPMMAPCSADVMHDTRHNNLQKSVTLTNPTLTNASVETFHDAIKT